MPGLQVELEPIEKYFLLLLYSPDASGKFAQPLRGKTWYQKEMFLLSKIVKNLQLETDYGEHMMGSYSEAVEEIADQFYISGFTERVGDSIKASIEGRTLAESVWLEATSEEKRKVTLTKTLLNDLDYYELLGLIYTEFPDSAKYSEVKQEVEQKRVDIAISLFRKGKVSLERAAKIANKSAEELLGTLEERKISVSEVETNAILQDGALFEEIRLSGEDSKHGRLVPWDTVKSRK